MILLKFHHQRVLLHINGGKSDSVTNAELPPHKQQIHHRIPPPQPPGIGGQAVQESNWNLTPINSSGVASIRRNGFRQSELRHGGNFDTINACVWSLIPMFL
jgi:hypothetical protein